MRGLNHHIGLSWRVQSSVLCSNLHPYTIQAAVQRIVHALRGLCHEGALTPTVRFLALLQCPDTVHNMYLHMCTALAVRRQPIWTQHITPHSVRCIFPSCSSANWQRKCIWCRQAISEAWASLVVAGASGRCGSAAKLHRCV